MLKETLNPIQIKDIYSMLCCINKHVNCLQYIVFDTQMMLGGKHKYSVSPEEYIFAALNLYLDIVNLFLFLLSIIGSARDWVHLQITLSPLMIALVQSYTMTGRIHVVTQCRKGYSYLTWSSSKYYKLYIWNLYIGIQSEIEFTFRYAAVRWSSQAAYGVV